LPEVGLGPGNWEGSGKCNRQQKPNTGQGWGKPGWTVNIKALNYLDIVILVLFAWGAFRGFSRGLIIMVASFIALTLGIVGAFKFSGVVAEWLVDTMRVSTPYLRLVSFTITFIGIAIAINIVAYLLSRILDVIALGYINRLLGSIFGILKMALLLSVFFIILNAFNRRHDFIPREITGGSLFYNRVAGLAPQVFPFLRSETLWQDIEEYFDLTHSGL
jgi:membrane protein required for colicin V production